MNKASKMEDFNKNDRSKIYQRFSIHGNFWHTSLPELMDQPNNGVSTADIPSWPLMEAGKICDQMKICDHYFEFNLVNLLLKSWISWSQICLKNYRDSKSNILCGAWCNDWFTQCLVWVPASGILVTWSGGQCGQCVPGDQGNECTSVDTVDTSNRCNFTFTSQCRPHFIHNTESWHSVTDYAKKL